MYLFLRQVPDTDSQCQLMEGTMHPWIQSKPSLQKDALARSDLIGKLEREGTLVSHD